MNNIDEIKNIEKNNIEKIIDESRNSYKIFDKIDILENEKISYNNCIKKINKRYFFYPSKIDKYKLDNYKKLIVNCENGINNIHEKIYETNYKIKKYWYIDEVKEEGLNFIKRVEFKKLELSKLINNIKHTYLLYPSKEKRLKINKFKKIINYYNVYIDHLLN
jgi:hypothetical protein